ncbi:MAG: hypothetical protein ACOYZ7_07775 [Chloroflexota bacterium]
MNPQRILQLLISFGILSFIAFVSEKSRVLASVVAVMPLNITIALWFVSTQNSSDPSLPIDLARMMLIGLIPTALFLVATWFGFRQGWSPGRALIVGYGVWLITMGIYRGIEWWLKA